ncbi:MAG: hypothetical protein EAZ85_02745 [Bacteroidetes bacterium]|nr:MAG: hypothetical protein EAZ85_02745 [Bacteroidota bacterium]TAG86102.1 MAG: hypothetical protein EAZ20_13485 [Bacteroidota bacterium]
MRLYLYIIFFIFFYFIFFIDLLLAQPNNLTAQNIEKLLEKSNEKKQAGDIKESSRFLNEVATIYWESKNYDQAINYFNQSIQLNESIGNQSGIISLYSNLALINADKESYQQSLFYFQKVYDWRKKSNEEGIRATLVNMAVVSNKLKTYEKSIIYLEESLELARQKYNLKDMRLCYGMLYETYSKMNNSQKSNEYFVLYRDINEMLTKKTEDKAAKYEKIKIENENLEKTKKIKELELELAQKELIKDEEKLISINRQVEDLMNTKSKQELAIENLQKDRKIKELAIVSEKNKNEAEKQKIQNRLESANNKIYYSITIIIFFGLIGLFLLYLFYDRKRKNELLTKQRDELNDLNQIKDKLFSIIAHDLRSPMIAFHNFTTLLRIGGMTEEEEVLMVDNMRKISGVTLETLDILLQWAKSQMVGINPKAERISLYHLVEKQRRFFQTTAQFKNITIENELTENDIAFADQVQIDTVLRNLINNAIKFTHKEGKITIIAHKTADKIYVGVQDTGVGISEENLKKIFGGKTNFTTKGTEREAGTGLGLMLCKEFVEANKGLINIKSKENEGTLITFSLPLK